MGEREKGILGVGIRSFPVLVTQDLRGNAEYCYTESSTISLQKMQDNFFFLDCARAHYSARQNQNCLKTLETRAILL
jgi:hypothetical protein